MRPGKPASPRTVRDTPHKFPKEHLIRMYRQLTALSLPVAAIALIAGCQAGSPAAPQSSTGPSASSAAAGPAVGSSQKAAPAGADQAAFCMQARAVGAANLVTIQDRPAAGSDSRRILARLDALTATAPPAIGPDFAKLDRLEHALLGGQLDPQMLAQVEDPDTIASLQRIEHYLTTNCGIHR
jgi:hypothetical protein